MQVWELDKRVCFSVCEGEFKGNLWRNILSIFFSENADVTIFVEIQG